eukprot:scaffold33649_cov191-Skeletonema_dohrnii-CCMP3373.AAC.2
MAKNMKHHKNAPVHNALLRWRWALMFPHINVSPQNRDYSPDTIEDTEVAYNHRCGSLPSFIHLQQ